MNIVFENFEWLCFIGMESVHDKYLMEAFSENKSPL